MTLPLPLELALPFLLSGELVSIAAVSRAAHAAALVSYQYRLFQQHRKPPPQPSYPVVMPSRLPMAYGEENPWTGGGCSRTGVFPTNNNGRVRNVQLQQAAQEEDDAEEGSSSSSSSNIPSCFYWQVDFFHYYYNSNANTRNSEEQHTNMGVTTIATIREVQQHQARFLVPPELQRSCRQEKLKLTHCSCLSSSSSSSYMNKTTTMTFLVVALSSAGVDDQEEMEENYTVFDERGVWGILYNCQINRSVVNTNSPIHKQQTQQEEQQLIINPPLAVQKLACNPWYIDENWFWDREDEVAILGQTARSANGKVFCTVTHLPEVGDSSPAFVSVFDIVHPLLITTTPTTTTTTTATFCRLRHQITVPSFCCDPDYSVFILALNKSGDLLAIVNNEQHDKGDFYLWNTMIQEEEGEQTRQPRLLFRDGTGWNYYLNANAFFTLDNDLVLRNNGSVSEMFDKIRQQQQQEGTWFPLRRFIVESLSDEFGLVTREHILA